MFRLNLKIVLRSLWKNRSSSVINIAGLSIGLASCLLLILYVSYEWNFDKQFRDSKGIYQVMVNVQDLNGHKVMTIDQTQNVLAQTLKQEYPEIAQIARTTSLFKRLLANGQKNIKVQSRYADPSFLDIFNYQFIRGDLKSALTQPNSIVLTESTARRLFGTADVLNKTLKFENQKNLKVTAVVKDLPENVTYAFEALVPWRIFETLNQWPEKPNWGNHSFNTLLRLNPGAVAEQLNLKIKHIVEKHFPVAKEDVFIYPLTKLHLYGHFVNGKSSGGKIEQLRIFVALALGILLLACINFINLSTAHAQRRAKEVGIKKSVGASKRSLVLQFLLESFILTVISVVISIVLAELFLPWFNHLLDINIRIDYLDPVSWLILTGVLLLTAFMAGFYPAFYLANFNPVQALKKQVQPSGIYALNLRQILVVLQFSFAVILIAVTLTIYKQMQFIKNRPLGYQSNGLIEVPHEGLLYERYDLLKNRLLASGVVTAVTQSSDGITERESSIRGLEWEGMSAGDKLIDFDQIYTTTDFTKTMGIRLLSGRDFSSKLASDTLGLLLSKKAVQVMNLKAPLGARILYQGQKRTVVGVFEDFVWGDRSKFGAPMVIAYATGISDAITMHLNPEKSLTESVGIISAVLKELNPNFPVEIRFIDNLNAAKLKEEAILISLSNLFGFLSIFISCMGLFGLSAYSSAQRTKEIGIRKVLGASVQELMAMLSSDFVKLVLISILISLPLAYMIMAKWLQNFDVQTPLSWWIFVLTALVTVFIAVLTVSWQTYKAARTNPVDALKYD